MKETRKQTNNLVHGAAYIYVFTSAIAANFKVFLRFFITYINS